MSHKLSAYELLFTDTPEAQEVWLDIIDGSIDDQHAVMKSVGELPREWESNHTASKEATKRRRALGVELKKGTMEPDIIPCR